MRILFVKPSSIGDIVHTLPALAAVKRALPESEISWAVEKDSAEILRNNPMLFRLIELDTKALRRKDVLGKTIKTAKQQLRELRASEFDLTIDFQGLLKSASISKLAKTTRRFGFSKRNLREPASRLLGNSAIDVDPGQNIILMNIALAEGALREYLSDNEFELDRSHLEFPVFADDIQRAEASEIARSAGGHFAVLNPAGGWETKLWHAEKYGQLADLLWDRLGVVSVISTAPNETALAGRAAAASTCGKTIIAQPGLKAFFELARSACVYIGGDTAPTHLAVAADCPVVGIFGPTEWWRNGSINPEDLCVERNDIDCRTDCHRRKCGHWICMDIEPETVFAAVAERIEKAGHGSR